MVQYDVHTNDNDIGPDGRLTRGVAWNVSLAPTGTFVWFSMKFTRTKIGPDERSTRGVAWDVTSQIARMDDGVGTTDNLDSLQHPVAAGYVELLF